jgi:hypothetical protein
MNEAIILEKTESNIKYVRENFSENKFEENLRAILHKIHEKGDHA